QLDRMLTPHPERVRLECDVFLDHDGRAVLCNDRSSVWRVGERRIERLGLRRLDLDAAWVDAMLGEVVVDAMRMPLDPDAWRAFESTHTLGRDGSRVPPGRYPIRAFALIGSNADHLKVTSPARRAGSMVPFIARPDGSFTARDLAAV